MLNHINSVEFQQAYQWAKQDHLIDDQDSSLIFLSWDILNQRLNHLRESFPAGVLHAIAVKTNPLMAVLKQIVGKGFGLESASMEELEFARETGAPASLFVFDSPVKRLSEIQTCIEKYQGLIINANSLEELERYPQNLNNINLGLRINPEQDVNAPALLNVSHSTSKFGVQISRRKDILRALLKHTNVNTLHIHSGSSMANLKASALNIKSIVELANELNSLRKNQGMTHSIKFIDIGGGIPADYTGQSTFSMKDYVDCILKEVPDLFESFKVITEFGQFIHANTCFAISDIEYLVDRKDHHELAYIHLGADMFVRKVYSTMQIAHRLQVLNSIGELKSGPMKRYDLAGPLCFAGDFLYKDIQLPILEEMDKLVIQDVGANTFSLWSRHCSRALPKVIAYSLKEKSISVIKAREKIRNR